MVYPNNAGISCQRSCCSFLRRVLPPGTRLKSTNHERILHPMQLPHLLQSRA